MSTFVNYHAVPDLAFEYMQGQTKLAHMEAEMPAAQPDCHWPMHARHVSVAHLVIVSWSRDPGVYLSYFVIQGYAENAPAYMYTQAGQ